MPKSNKGPELDEIEYKVMSGLKDFQQATVNRIYHLYREKKQRRILVSDEVGLGKTLIARGTIAKVAKLRKKEGDNLFKVVYICSNVAIAEQNLQKLRITNDVKTERTSSSRLSMQHLNIFKQEYDTELHDSFIQLIPLTPDTSFRMTEGTGIVSERALMYVILRRLHELRKYSYELGVAMMDYACSSWDNYRYIYEAEVTDCNKKTEGKYLRYMISKLNEELYEEWYEGVTYIAALKQLCRDIRKNNGKRVSENSVIGQLRYIFAKISIEKLQPDLVIMDEFQRFRDLLIINNDTEPGMLARKFFKAKNVRMLLLSATPYKMYSTLEEIDESRMDEHYTEFLSVMDFLNEDTKDDTFRTIWKDYSVKLREMTLGDTTIISAKNAAEDAMYQTVCRTERISASENADIIDDSDINNPLEVVEQDVLSYINAQKLIESIDVKYHVPVDYIKSTPYLMSFMRDYKLKKDVEKYFKAHPEEISKKIYKETFWLSKKKISKYEKIPCNNSRLDRVMGKTMQNGIENLLWIPPSRPYYELQGVYKNAGMLSKTLIFSSWEMVPRMLACMISYEAERRTVGKLAKDYHDGNVQYFYGGEKRYPSARMNFTVNSGIPSAMSLFCLIYPSVTLSDLYDPIACLNAGMNIKAIQRTVRKAIIRKMREYPSKLRGQQDKRWYFLAPMLFDGEDHAYSWLNYGDELADYADDEERSKKQKGFNAHLVALRHLLDETFESNCSNLGRQPDDLVDVLTDMTIAAPAICVDRTYKRYLKNGEAVPVFWSSQLARVFINRMNTPESTAVVELACGRKSEDAHWQNLLTYCKQGNLQAVFDEYAHLISCGIDHNEDMISQVHKQMMSAMNIRTTQYNVDTYRSFRNRMYGEKDKPANIRTHFAVAFTKGEGKESDADRKKIIRNAFNSPFRPFVLATTSIGQEGLDFHNYCRKIVHWNLPSNPIDLEQREGRINRFECLAIRQNVALRYGSIKFKKDIWNEMFNEASRSEKTRGASDLIPYWGLRESEGMVKIERIVPMYPFSRDEVTYERLIKILSLYRLTLGQARQEELLEHLFKNCDDPEKLKELFINLSPFYKEKKC